MSTGEVVTYSLFPHVQEPSATFGQIARLMEEVRQGGDGVLYPWRQTTQEPAPWFTRSHGVDPQKVIEALHRVDWAHPPLLVYRSSVEDSWSHLRIVQRVGTLWGNEGEEG